MFSNVFLVIPVWIICFSIEVLECLGHVFRPAEQAMTLFELRLREYPKQSRYYLSFAELFIEGAYSTTKELTLGIIVSCSSRPLLYVNRAHLAVVFIMLLVVIIEMVN